MIRKKLGRLTALLTAGGIFLKKVQVSQTMGLRGKPNIFSSGNIDLKVVLEKIFLLGSAISCQESPDQGWPWVDKRVKKLLWPP
jgi:hypothetical protein